MFNKITCKYTEINEVYDMINYAPLWETMKKKEITQYQLIKDYRFSTGTLDALRKNKSITAYTIEKLCLILDCQPNDIMKVEKEPFKKDER